MLYISSCDTSIWATLDKAWFRSGSDESKSVIWRMMAPEASPLVRALHTKSALLPPDTKYTISKHNSLLHAWRAHRNQPKKHTSPKFVTRISQPTSQGHPAWQNYIKIQLPKALANELADVDMATGSELAATAVLPVVDRLNELGSIKTKLEPLANRTPADLLASRDRIAHCIFCGAKLLRCPWPVVLL